MRDTGSAHAASVSAAVRYARILKAFSPLISSRSAISAKTCATCRLSTREPVAFDVEIEDAGAASGQRVTDGVVAIRGTIAEQASAAAGSADLCRRRPRASCAGDQLVDRGRRHTGRELLAGLPFRKDGVADAIPVFSRDRVAHRASGVADSLEAVEHVAVAVDMLLGDFPVVR